MTETSPSRPGFSVSLLTRKQLVLGRVCSERGDDSLDCRYQEIPAENSGRAILTMLLDKPADGPQVVPLELIRLDSALAEVAKRDGSLRHACKPSPGDGRLFSEYST